MKQGKRNKFISCGGAPFGRCGEFVAIANCKEAVAIRNLIGRNFQFKVARKQSQLEAIASCNLILRRNCKQSQFVTIWNLEFESKWKMKICKHFINIFISFDDIRFSLLIEWSIPWKKIIHSHVWEKNTEVDLLPTSNPVPLGCTLRNWPLHQNNYFMYFWQKYNI